MIRFFIPGSVILSTHVCVPSSLLSWWLFLLYFFLTQLALKLIFRALITIKPDLLYFFGFQDIPKQDNGIDCGVFVCQVD